MKHLFLLALLGLAAAAAGQTKPDDEPPAEAPPPPPPLSPPEQVGAPALLDPALARGQRWVLRVGVQPGWDSNPLVSFAGAPVESGVTSDFVGRGSLDLARLWTGARSELVLAGQASGVAYAEQSRLNQGAFAASVKGETRPSARTSLRALGSFADGYARDVSRFVAPGQLLPLVRSRALGATAGITSRLGARTTADLEGGYSSMVFDSTDVADASQLQASARLAREFGAGASGELSYQFRREVPNTGAGVDATAVTSHSVLLGGGGTLRRGVEVKASAGVLYIPATATSDSDVSPSGAASLSVSSRRGRVEASYERVPQVAYGYGRATVSHNGRLAYGLNLGSRTSLVLGATYGRAQDPGDPVFLLLNVTGTAGLTTSFGRGYRTGLTYVYARSELREAQVERAPVDSHAVGLSFSKEWSW